LIRLCDGKIIWKNDGFVRGHTYIAISNDETKLLVSCGNIFVQYDLENGNEINKFYGHNNTVFREVISSIPAKNLKINLNLSLSFTSIYLDTVYLYTISSDDWIVFLKNGLFDASVGAMKFMHYVVGMDVIEFEQLKHRYWQPGLLQIVTGANKEKLREVPAFDYVRLYPELTLKTDNFQLTINLINRGGGIGKVEVYVDNIELTEDARISPADISKKELTINFNLRPFLTKFRFDTINTLKVIARNAEGYLSGRPEIIEYKPRLKELKGVLPIIDDLFERDQEPPAFYGLFVGVSDYAGKNIDLAFASKDAKDITTAIEMGANNLFGKEKTHLVCLNSDNSIDSLLPTKKNINHYFQALSNSSPKDIVVLYFSGHGVNWGGQEGDFYFLTDGAEAADAYYLNDPAIRKTYTFSSNEMTYLINQIPARKKVLILDACSSGQASEDILLAMNTKKDVPGSQIRALDRMKDRTGFYILAGSAANQASYETSLYGQGVLTYALLRGMKGECLRVDGGEEYVDVKKLFQYAEDQVPLLAENIGGIQKPFARGIEDKGSFDIGRMTGEDKAKIIISEPKPVFITAMFMDENKKYDVLKLTEKLNSHLRDISAKGKEAPLVFTEGTYPNAYSISGSYKVKEGSIIINFIILKGNEVIIENLEVSGEIDKIDDLLSDIVEMTRKKI